MNIIRTRDLIIAQAIKWATITFLYSVFVREDEFFILVPTVEFLVSGLALITLIVANWILNKFFFANDYAHLFIMSSLTFIINQIGYSIIGRTIPIIHLINQSDMNVLEESLLLTIGCLTSSFVVLIIALVRKNSLKKD